MVAVGKSMESEFQLGKGTGGELLFQQSEIACHRRCVQFTHAHERTGGQGGLVVAEICGEPKNTAVIEPNGRATD